MRELVSIIPDLIVGKSKLHGKGVFAGRHFNSGDVIITFAGDLYTYEDTLGPYEGMFLQVGKDLYMGPSGQADDLINHSCDPTAAVVMVDRTVVLKAIRPINPMMEITYDYSIFVIDDPWTMQCNCGTAKCRKIIADYKTLPEDLRRHYEYMKIVPAYVLEA